MFTIYSLTIEFHTVKDCKLLLSSYDSNRKLCTACYGFYIAK